MFLLISTKIVIWLIIIIVKTAFGIQINFSQTTIIHTINLPIVIMIIIILAERNNMIKLILMIWNQGDLINNARFKKTSTAALKNKIIKMNFYPIAAMDLII